MGLFCELVATVMLLVTKPFYLCKLMGFFCVRTTSTVIQTWIEFIKAAISFHVNVIWQTMLWMVGLVSLPVQLLTAFQREKLLEKRLHEMQFELETLLWDSAEIDGQLQTATKERRIMESMLIELEEELDCAIAKIELLDKKLQKLKDENICLKEIQGKAAWRRKGHNDTGNRKDVGITGKHNAAFDIPLGKTRYRGSGIPFEDLITKKDAWEAKSGEDTLNYIKASSTSSGSIDPLKPVAVSKDLETDEALAQRREIALSQSLFSAVLSLLVGMIVWKAEDPCMPLVIALFTVVGMSLKSVVQFFSTIRNKPASDAIALLSFNWFILGTLTYPSLPKIALMLTPVSLRILDRIAIWLGISIS